ncbi:transcriptional regulator [Stenotrophomonas panacihumi]|uniref:Transcriptional regulator n=1 Tax=Stenotrophomonas panacihumi TaxID=676599 RepID=A0A0R0AJL5_9GAMM|nr:helix-turn-helix transcriptional regulator [Stenotrophomonas panacihumi]KRG40952.1 transcriptional regulator [Stenotrophomonas panacihumi]PTN53560.1 AraC family transcriptional regulator [Stenotrophomonas panacihumi]
MTAAPDPALPLLARLARLADCARSDGFACINARHEHGVQSVDVPRPQLAILLQGTKQVRCDGHALHLQPGDVLLVTRACRMDVVNVPDPHSGLYQTVIVPLCEEVLAAARGLWREMLPPAGDAVAAVALPPLGAELVRWQDALTDAHYAEARLSLTALVIDLCRQGHGALLLPPQPSLASELRALVAAQPARDWQSRDFEEAFGLSGATLRRRLAEEHTGLRELVADARLAQAMELLYTTRLPLKSVAARVGYRSVGSFSRRFQARYQLDPALIGNAARAAA